MQSSCIAPGAAPGIRCPGAREPGSLFCRRHEQFPAAQRGGWLSAERRRMKLAASQETAIPSQIITRLWIGGKPPFDRDLPEFDVLVLCARELQPERLAFGRQVIRVPLPDSALTGHEVRRALLGGQAAAKALAGGRRVLVTCAAGLNRSALVTGLAMGLTTHMSATDIILRIRERRAPEALHNTHFCGYLQQFIGVGRDPAKSASSPTR